MATQGSTTTSPREQKDQSSKIPGTYWTEQSYDYETAESRALDMAQNAQSQKLVQGILKKLNQK